MILQEDDVIGGNASGAGGKDSRNDKEESSVSSKRGRGQLGGLIRRYFAFFGLIFLIILGSQISAGFVSLGNVRDILTSNAPTGLVCVGMTFVIISGNFDLSVGGIFALSAIAGAVSTNDFGTAIGIVIAIGVGMAAGAINGILAGVLGMNSFITTLGTGSVFEGLAYIMSHQEAVSVAARSFQKLGAGSWLSIPVSIWILVFAFVIGGIALRFTIPGYYLYATGGNAEAARLVGIPVRVVRACSFVIVGALAGLAGLMFVSNLGIAQPDIGASIALNSIAIVVIGGTSMYGGEGGIGRTALGFLLIAVLIDIFDLLALSASLQLLVEGGVLVLAVSLNSSIVEVISTLFKSRKRRRIVASTQRPDAIAVMGGD